MRLARGWDVLIVVVGAPLAYVSVQLLADGDLGGGPTGGDLIRFALLLLAISAPRLFRAEVSWPSGYTFAERTQVRAALWSGQLPESARVRRLLAIRVAQRLEGWGEPAQVRGTLLRVVAVGFAITVGLLVLQPSALPGRLLGAALLTALLLAWGAGSVWMGRREGEQLRQLQRTLHEPVALAEKREPVSLRLLEAPR